MKQLNTKSLFTLNRDGEWFHDGQLITHERTVALLFKNLYREGRDYFLQGERVPVPVTVEDTPFFVEKIWEKKNGFFVCLSDGSEEILNPSTIYFTEGGNPNCLVKDKKIPARLTRRVYYQLMKFLVEKQDYLGLQVGDLFYPLQKAQQSSSAPQKKKVKKPHDHSRKK